MSSLESRTELVLELAEEFLRRYRQGERPSLREYINRYPELAAEIKDVFPTMAMMENIAVADESIANPAAPAPKVRADVAPLAQRQLGDYRIIREIGHGGMGVVYEAEQVSLGRHVALKVLPHKTLANARTKKRFEREAKAAAKLHHTNIVPVFVVGEHEGLPYYAMQFIQGMGLDMVIAELARLQARDKNADSPKTEAYCEDRSASEAPARDFARALVTGVFRSDSANPAELEPASRLQTDLTVDAAPGTASEPTINTSGARPRPDASSASSFIMGSRDRSGGSKDSKKNYWHSVARVGLQVAEALEYAHGQGVLHRDIKPSNLLLDTSGTVWVADFGLAKAASAPGETDDNLTQSGDVLGTLRYLPPEALDGKSDARGDIYSLGLTLYELVAAQPAFAESERNKLLKQVTTGEPTRLDRRCPAAPRDLVTIIHKAIDREPVRRYQKAQELAEDLRRFLEDRPVKARRSSPIERLARWARRNQQVAASLAAIGVLLLVAAGASTLAAVRFNGLARERESAREAADGQRQKAEEATDEARRKGEAERWGRYRSNIAAASAALQLQNSGAARSALEEAPQEHRNWEWQYLHSQLDGAALVLHPPGGKVKSLILSPTGRHIAVSCINHNDVYLYDVATGREVVILRGHSAPVTSVAYRPDGEQIATSGNDQTIRLWDPATGRQTALLKPEGTPPNLDRDSVVVYNSDGSRLLSSPSLDGGAGMSRLWDATIGQEIAVLGNRQEPGGQAAFSPDGKLVAVASHEFVHLCDAVTGRRVAALGPHAGPVRFLAYSPDGKRIASTSLGGSNDIHLWDGATGASVAVLHGHTASVTSVLFCADGSRLVSGCQYPENKARLWDAATGQPLAVLAGHKNEINPVAFSSDGKRLVTPSSDQTARLWDGHTGQFLAVLAGHTDRVEYVVVSPDSARVVTASDDATLRLWDAQTGDLIGVLRGHGDAFGPQCPLGFTPDSSRLVSGSTDGTVRIWDRSLVERNGILRGHESYVYDVAFNPNGQQVASVAWDGTARLWDATTGRQTGLLRHDTTIINAVDYSRDGRQLLTAERELGVRLWDVASQKPARTLHFSAPGFWDNRACLNPAGTLLASGCNAGPVRLWDVATGREVARLEGHHQESKDVSFHPDGSLLATTGIDGTVRLWDVATRASVAVLRGHTDVVWRATFSADGKLLASGSTDKTLRLWDAQTHTELASIQVGSTVYSVAFSPDGTRLAAGCRDNTIRLIDVARRQQVAELRGHSDYVHAVAWGPDGTQLVSGSGDFTVRIWDSLSVQGRASRSGTK